MPVRTAVHKRFRSADRLIRGNRYSVNSMDFRRLRR